MSVSVAPGGQQKGMGPLKWPFPYTDELASIGCLDYYEG